MDYLLEGAVPVSFRRGILGILEDCDFEFVPPLSSRISATQKVFVSAVPGKFRDDGALNCYFLNLLSRHIVLAVDVGRVAGFLSYIPNFTSEFFPDVQRLNYISTIAVSHDYRGNGIATEMYKHLLAHSCTDGFLTRTWSTNEGHIHILSNLGFNLLARLPDDRDPGIDTVYYGKRIP